MILMPFSPPSEKNWAWCFPNFPDNMNHGGGGEVLVKPIVFWVTPPESSDARGLR